MSTQLVAIFVVLGLALGLLFLGWSACALSGRISEAERRIEIAKALGWQERPSTSNYPTDETEHNDD